MQRSKFQSTLPHGERLNLPKINEALKRFQSTLPHGERPSLANAVKRIFVFQSTLPHGERQIHLGEHHSTSGFNPRSHMGSDLLVGKSFFHVSWFQSTLPHGERLGVFFTNSKSYVSIHAPTWGATGTARPDYSQVPVSIHAPTWGATGFYQGIVDKLKFQSTLPHGERLSVLLFLVKLECFNPRSHMGSDPPN